MWKLSAYYLIRQLNTYLFRLRQSQGRSALPFAQTSAFLEIAKKKLINSKCQSPINGIYGKAQTNAFKFHPIASLIIED